MKVKEIVEGRIENGVWVDKPGPVPAPSGDPDDGILNRPAPRPVKPKPSVNPATPDKTTPPPKDKSKSGTTLGTIKDGVWTSDPPKKGEKGVPVPVPLDETYSEELEQLRGLAFGK